MPDSLEIPEFLKIPQADRKAVWDKHRVVVKPASETGAGEDWRKERNRIYNEAARKDDTGAGKS